MSETPKVTSKDRLSSLGTGIILGLSAYGLTFWDSISPGRRLIENIKLGNVYTDEAKDKAGHIFKVLEFKPGTEGPIVLEGVLTAAAILAAVLAYRKISKAFA